MDGVAEVVGDTVGLFGGLADGVMNSLFKMGAVVFLIGVAAMMLYIVLADLVLGGLGIIKAETPITVQLPQGIYMENASILGVSHQKSPKVETAPVTDGQALLKTNTHNQSVYLSYDGALVDSTLCLTPSIVEPSSASAGFTTDRILLVHFRNASGSAISPKQISVSNSKGLTFQGTLMDDGRLMLFLPEDASDLTLAFSAEGYATSSICLDWNENRVGELEVFLNAA
jgi:hypothetical protein